MLFLWHFGAGIDFSVNINPVRPTITFLHFLATCINKFDTHDLETRLKLNWPLVVISMCCFKVRKTPKFIVQSESINFMVNLSTVVKSVESNTWSGSEGGWCWCWCRRWAQGGVICISWHWVRKMEKAGWEWMKAGMQSNRHYWQNLSREVALWSILPEVMWGRRTAAQLPADRT